MDIDSLLKEVTKPGRYIGLEPGTIKPKQDARLRWALAFPDVYDIGTSHLGLQILYSLLNSIEEVSCERAFAPWLDFEQQLRTNGLSLTSMESRRSLRDFDILGFTLQHEMLYSNILNMLDLAGIPIRNEDRTEDDPIVIAGGPCAVNPEPLADFIDLFCIGDGEGLAVELSKTMLKCKDDNLDRKATIKALSRMPGTYVPDYYKPVWGQDGKLEGFKVHSDAPREVKAQKVSLKGAFYPTRQIVPLIDSVHDRISVEIRRGCTRGCRFCQAGMISRPVRERPVDEIVRLSQEAVEISGFDGISLLSLSSGDYSRIGLLLKNLKASLAHKNCKIAVPSIRLDRSSEEFWAEMSSVNQRSLTFAPEAGSERLRKAINKDLSNEEIFDTVRRSFQQGLKTVKLYFMIGLPTETMEDLQATVDLVQELKKLLYSGKGKKNLHVSIAPFVPKPHTPFEWFGQNTRSQFQEKATFLSENLRSRDVKVQWHDLDRSFLEAAFARGDRRLGKVIETAWRAGARMDDWSDCFDINLWERSFEEEGVDPTWYANRDRDPEESFPWDVIDVGVKKEFLMKEYQRAQAFEQTPDCFVGPCQGCGCCGESLLGNLHSSRCCADLLRIEKAPEVPEISTVDEDSAADGSSEDYQNIPPHWYRIEFFKPGRVRFLSHLDIQRLFLQALNRTNLPVRMTQGFRPHPKISFGMATPTGVESAAEFVDLAMNEQLEEEAILQALSERTGELLRFNRVKHLGPQRTSLVKLSKQIVYDLTLESGDPDKADLLVERVLENMSAPIGDEEPVASESDQGIVSLDIVTMIDMIQRLPGEDRASFRMSVRVDDGRTPKVRDMITWLEALVEGLGVIACRKESVLGETPEGDLVSLIDL